MGNLRSIYMAGRSWRTNRVQPRQSAFTAGLRFPGKIRSNCGPGGGALRTHPDAATMLVSWRAPIRRPYSWTVSAHLVTNLTSLVSEAGRIFRDVLNQE